VKFNLDIYMMSIAFVNLGTPELILLGIIIFPLILIIIALIDILKNQHINVNTKILWFILIIIAPVIGALIYLFWGRYQKNVMK
jgi:hypothetical protein